MNPSRAALPTYFEDFHFDLARGHLHLDDVSRGFAKQGFPYWTGNGDFACADVCFRRGNELERLFAARPVIFDADVRQDIRLIRVHLFFVHQAGLRHGRFHLGDARFEQALGFLGGVVLRIFGQVAFFPRLLDRSGNTGALFRFQKAQFFLEPVKPFLGQVYDISVLGSDGYSGGLAGGEQRFGLALTGRCPDNNLKKEPY